MREINGRFSVGHLPIGGFKKGSQHTLEAKQKVSESLMGKIGEASRRWKGQEAGYVAKHLWIVKHFGKATRCDQKGCNFQNPKRFEWHNISGNYERNVSDYVQLCPSCHRKIDMGRLRLCVV